jgi:hypothetical protein
MIADNEFLKAGIGEGSGFHNPDFAGLCESVIERVRNYLIKRIPDFGAVTRRRGQH